jgi:transcriptional regulator with XRE-family HTH domain
MKLLVGRRIKRIRTKNGLKQSEVYRGIVSASHYSNIENDRYSPSNETLRLIGDKLLVPHSYLLEIHKDNIELNVLLHTFANLINNGKPEEIAVFLETHKDVFEFIPSIKQEAYFNLLLFLNLYYFNDTNLALEFYKNNIEEYGDFLSDFDLEQQQKYHYISSLYYYQIKKFEISVIHLKKVLKYEEDLFLKPKITFNIAATLYNLYQYDEALVYAKDAKTLYLNAFNWEKTADCCNLIAVLLKEKNLLNESEEYIKKGFHLSKEDSYELRAKLHHNLALIRREQENYKEAMENINICIQLKSKIESTSLFDSYREKLKILLLIEDIVLLNRTLTNAHALIRSKTNEAHYHFIVAQKNFILKEITAYEISISKSIDIFLAQEEWKELRRAAEHYSIFLEVNKKYKKSLEHQKLCTLALKKIYGER